jgi:hypothetical protein
MTLEENFSLLSLMKIQMKLMNFGRVISVLILVGQKTERQKQKR